MTPRPTTGRPTARTLIVAAAAIAATLTTTSCDTPPKKTLDTALLAYEAGDFGQSARLAHESAQRATGLERERARYLEGISLLKADRNTDAIAVLQSVTEAGDKQLAADARVSLGTAEIRLRRFDAAAESYRRAALILPPAEAARAYSVAARCYDAAGLTKKAEEARSLAGEPRVLAVERAAAEPPTVSNPRPPAAAAPTPAPPSEPKPSTPTSKIVNGMEIEPIRFAVQAGAFSEESRAREVAASIRPKCVESGLGEPRVVRKERGKDPAVFAVQFGEFPTRLAAGQALKQFPRLGYTVERWER